MTRILYLLSSPPGQPSLTVAPSIGCKYTCMCMVVVVGGWRVGGGLVWENGGHAGCEGGDMRSGGRLPNKNTVCDCRNICFGQHAKMCASSSWVVLSVSHREGLIPVPSTSCERTLPCLTAANVAAATAAACVCVLLLLLLCYIQHRLVAAAAPSTPTLRSRRRGRMLPWLLPGCRWCGGTYRAQHDTQQHSAQAYCRWGV